MDSELQKQLKVLKEMHEDDFTRDIVKPLFESMGYNRVDFNGGPLERGKDLIAQMIIPPRTKPRVTYIQSKKIGAIQNASESAKFSQLLHQLRQCVSGTITTISGEILKADEVYIACPEPAKSRFIEEVGSQLFGLQPTVELLDGPKIIDMIKEFKPGLLKLLTTIEDKLSITCNEHLINNELLNALNAKSGNVLNNYYSDLSFFVGSVDSNALFHIDVDIHTSEIKIEDVNVWEKIKIEHKFFSANFQINLFSEEIDNIEQNFTLMKTKYKSKENTKNIQKYSEIESTLRECSISLSQIINDLQVACSPANSSYTKKLSKQEINQVKELLTKIKARVESNFNQKNFELLAGSQFSSINSQIEKINGLFQQIASQKEKRDQLKVKLAPIPSYNFTFNQTLKLQLNSYKNSYITGVKALHNTKGRSLKIKDFLKETEEALMFLERLIRADSPVSRWFNYSNKGKADDRVSISPHDIFESRKDIAVYGGAGVGKTTTLQAYATQLKDHSDNISIYIPLNKLVERLQEIIVSAESREFLKSQLLLKVILMSKGFEPTPEMISEAQIALPPNLTLILDGLDEIYTQVHEIIPAITDFKTKFPKAQLIISSRDCVSYLNKIDFLGITLLPFTEDQLENFILGWMNNKTLAAKLVEEVKKNNLYEHIKTPLLATITCSLTENGVKTPKSEYEIYDERLLLLTGEYDKHKKIDRQSQKSQNLIRVARKLAFSMQQDNLRSLSKERIISRLNKSLSNHYEASLIEKCVEELIDPCNILIRDPISKNYSFGHFRFQEHLASTELKQNREIDITELAVKDWWVGTLSLYAQEIEFTHLIEDLYHRHNNIQNALTTLKAMINSAPSSRRANLNLLVEQYDKADYFDEITSSYDGDYSFY